MPFQVEEFRDLIRLLAERPEWRAELRQLVLTDELLTLPELVRAAARAALLDKAGLPAMPVVAGKSVTRDAVALARTLAVWQVTDGQMIPPDQEGVC